MKRSNTSARNAVSGSTEFPWNWKLKDLESRPKNGHTVFSCFSCGGGSSMGYKLAGYTVVGNCEIDADMIKIYRKNNHPEHSFLMDIRDFVKLPDEEIPEELWHLDILDGSPPCSVFSMAGSREDGWNVEKTFREGQAKQRLAFADMRIGSAKIGRFAKWHNSLVAIDIRSGALCAVIQQVVFS